MIFNDFSELVDQYNSTSCISIKMKPLDIKHDPHINCPIEFNIKKPKYKVGDRVRVL